MKIKIWNVISFDTDFNIKTFTNKAEAEAEFRRLVELDWQELKDTPFPDSVSDAYDALCNLRDYTNTLRFEDLDLDLTTGKFSRRAAFSTLEMEAALCAWEWMLENVKHPAFRGIWEGLGYAAMRSISQQAGSIALAVYDRMVEQHYEFVGAYDWEFVPSVLKLIDWPTLAEDNQYGGPAYEPDIEAMLQAVIVEHPEEMQHFDPKLRWLNRARHAAKRAWEYPDLINDHLELFEQAFAEGQDPREFVEATGRDLNLTSAKDWK